jgi:two-component system, NarL family, nitrate/nitrite response regulator NarL
MSNAQLKILVAIDHHLFANGLTRLLGDVDGVTVCSVVNNGNKLVEEYGALQPDIALVDLNIPNLNGIEATRKIMKDFPNAKIIILSLYVNTSLIKQLKNSGVKGYLESDCDFENLVYTIRKVNFGTEMFDYRQYRRTSRNSFDRSERILTEKEVEVLRFIADGFTNAEIADYTSRSVQTIDSHRKKLLEKLEVRNSVELVSKALRKGIIVYPLMVLISFL